MHHLGNFFHYSSSYLHEEWDEDQLKDPEVEHMLKSFRWIRCSYTHFINPSQHHLLSLRALFAFSRINDVTCF